MTVNHCDFMAGTSLDVENFLRVNSSVAKSAQYNFNYFIPFCAKNQKNIDRIAIVMKISLKTGIEHRLILSELYVLLGKLRNFIEFFHGILKYG